MNLKFVGLGGAGALTAVGVTTGCLYLNSSKTLVVPSGKTLKQRYPDLKVREYQTAANAVEVNNSFWWDSAEKLRKKYYTDEKIWTFLLSSIKDSATKGGYHVGENYFNIDSRSDSFLVGYSQIGQILSKYCVVNLDKENEAIEDYPNILKDLCT